MELWYGVLEALLYLLLTRDWSSHADLSGSGLHKLIAVFNTLSTPHLVAVSHSMLTISLRLASLPPFPHRFQVAVSLVPLFSLSVLLVLSIEQQWLNQHAMWKYCIAHK